MMPANILPKWEESTIQDATSTQQMMRFSLQLSSSIAVSLFALCGKTNGQTQEWNYKLSVNHTALDTRLFPGCLTVQQAQQIAAEHAEAFLTAMNQDIHTAITNVLAVNTIPACSKTIETEGYNHVRDSQHKSS